MLSMNAIDKTKLTPDFWCSSVFVFNEDGKIVCAENNYRRFGASVCLVSDNHYWHAKREFKAENPVDLWRVFNAERSQISPIEGHVFYKIQSCHTHR